MLYHFRAYDNRINGSIAARKVCQFVSGGLQYFNMRGNLLSGPIPQCLLGEQSTLMHIFLDENNISSSLPPNLPEDSKLVTISFDRAGLTGALPESMANLRSLKILHLSRNGLSGTIPAEIGLLPSLVSVDLDSNKLTGAVPATLLTNPTMRILDIGNNSFTEMPGAWNTAGSAGRSLSMVDVHINSIKGPLPIGLLTSNVSILALSFNQFDGPLPDRGNLLPMAWTIVLNNNELTGSIPEAWSDMGILTGDAIDSQFILSSILDLSDNMLSGKIPRFLLDAQNLPRELLQYQGIHLEGNSFECVKLSEFESVRHLRGAKECDPEPEEVPQEPAELAQQPDESVEEDTLVEPVEVPQEPADPDQEPDESVEEDSAVPQEEREVEVQVSSIATPQGMGEEHHNDDTTVTGFSELNDEQNGRDSTSTSGLTIAASAVVVVIVVTAAVFAAFVWWRRRRKSQVQEGGAGGSADNVDSEVNRGVRVRFEKYADEGAEVQMFNGQRSSAL